MNPGAVPPSFDAPPDTGLPNPSVTMPPSSGGEPSGPPPDQGSPPPQTGLPNPVVVMPQPDASAPPCSSDPQNLEERIWEAANAYRGTPTGNLPGGGSNSCASALQVVLQRAGIFVPAYLTAAMDTWRNAALSGDLGGSVFATGQAPLASRGGIIIWPEAQDPEYGHIGVCADSGCDQTWSNHSGVGGWTSAFAYDPVTKRYITGGDVMYPAPLNTYLIWEPDHIP